MYSRKSSIQQYANYYSYFLDLFSLIHILYRLQSCCCALFQVEGFPLPSYKMLLRQRLILSPTIPTRLKIFSMDFSQTDSYAWWASLIFSAVEFFLCGDELVVVSLEKGVEGIIASSLTIQGGKYRYMMWWWRNSESWYYILRSPIWYSGDRGYYQFMNLVIDNTSEEEE